MGYRNIAYAGEELFLIETPGEGKKAALCGDAELGPPPDHAQVVGTVVFSKSEQYRSQAAWERDRRKHRVRKGSRLDWKGAGEMHAASETDLGTPLPNLAECRPHSAESAKSQARVHRKHLSANEACGRHILTA